MPRRRSCRIAGAGVHRPAPAAALALALLALGCAAEADEDAVAAMQQVFVSARASLAAAGAGPAAALPALAPQAAAVPVPPPPGPRLRGAAPPASAAALMGAPAERMRHMLGEPSLRRAEGDAEIWLYEAAACRLDIVLYPGGAGGLVVAHAAARAHGGADGVTEAACLSAIAAAPAPGPWTAGNRRA